MRSLSLILAGLILATWPGSLAGQGNADKPVLVLDSGGHTAAVRQALFTPDDRQVITISDDKTVRIWDVASGENVRVLRPPIGPGDEGRLFCAALSPRGRVLAVAGDGVKGREGAISVIDLTTGRMEKVLTGHIGAVNALAFSPDGDWLASGGQDATVRLWNLVTGRDRVMRGHEISVMALAFSPDSKRLVSVGAENRALLWVVGETKSLRRLDGPPVRVGLAWSPDGKTIAIGYKDGTIRLWNENGTLRKVLSVKTLGRHSLCFTNDSRALFLAGSRCGVVNLEGKELVAFTQYAKQLKAGVVIGALSHDGRLAVTARQADEVFLWRTADAGVVQRLGGRGQTTWSVGWSPDGQTVAWGTQAKNGPLQHTLSLSELEIRGAAGETYQRSLETLNGLSLVLGKRTTIKKGTALVSNLALRAPERQCGTFVPSSHPGTGPRLAIGGSALGLFDAGTGKRLRTFKGAHSIRAVAPSRDGRYLLTASNNQALTVWDVDRDEALLSLFFAGREWIAWTSEGYYACSPGGEQLMGWHVNNGPDQLATFHPAARFHNSLYRPDVIKLLLREGSVARALAAADKAVGKASQRVAVANVLPPTVLVKVIVPNHKKPREVKVEAVAHATAKHPVTALRLFLDGRPYGGKKAKKKVARPGSGPVRETWQLTLPPGAHRLTVQAECTVSKGFSEPVEFEASRGLKPVPNTPETLKQELPRLHVLAIGISAYPGDLRLRFATKDATVLAQTLANSGKALFRPGMFEVLTDAQATRANILDRLEKLPDQVAAGDVAVITFAGHGSRDATGKFYLLPVDANPKKLLSTCVDGDQVKNVLASLPCKVILVLDACHSAAVGGVVSNLVRDLVTEDRGVIVMCAAMGREVALESDKVGHGFFTKALVEGLSGNAKSNDGKVYLHMLDPYIYNRVTELSADRQHPAITRPTSIRSFALARP